MEAQIVDLRNKSNANKITIVFVANRPFFAICHALVIEGYKIVINELHSDKNDSYCKIKFSAFKKKDKFDSLIKYLANTEFCKRIYVYDYQEIDYEEEDW